MHTILNLFKCSAMFYRFCNFFPIFSFFDAVKCLPIVAVALRQLNLFMMGFFGAAHRWGVGAKSPPSLKSAIHPTMMKLGTVILYLKKILKIYESHDTLLEFCWHQ